MSDKLYSFDTNILIYAIDNTAGEKHNIAVELIDTSLDYQTVLCLQTLTEFYSASTRKGKMPIELAQQQIDDWQQLFPIIHATPASLTQSFKLLNKHQLSFWDALLLATMQNNNVTHLLTEDMHDGSQFDGLMLINPFNKNFQF